MAPLKSMVPPVTVKCPTWELLLLFSHRIAPASAIPAPFSNQRVPSEEMFSHLSPDAGLHQKPKLLSSTELLMIFRPEQLTHSIPLSNPLIQTFSRSVSNIVCPPAFPSLKQSFVAVATLPEP